MSTKFSVSMNDEVYIGELEMTLLQDGTVYVKGEAQPLEGDISGLKSYLRANEIRGVAWEEESEH